MRNFAARLACPARRGLRRRSSTMNTTSTSDLLLASDDLSYAIRTPRPAQLA